MMKMPIAGLLLAVTVLAGCAPYLQSHDAECHLKTTIHGVCGVWVPRVPGPSTGSSAAQVPLTRKEELRRR